MSKLSLFEENGKKYLKISVSKAKQFKQCKKAFKFNYIDHLPKITRDYHILGTFCHEILETFHLAFIKGVDLPFSDQMNISWKNAVQEHKKNLTPEIKKEAREMIGGYLKLITEQKNNGQIFNVIGVEDNFKQDLDGKVILNGMIDRVQLDPDGVLHVADYKTTKNKKYLKGDWFQLLTYCYVLLVQNPDLEKIRASYILLRHNFEYIGKDFSRTEIMKVKDDFIELYEEMMAEEEFAANPQILCSWCEYLDHCDEGKKYVEENPRFIKEDRKAFGEVKW